MLDLKQTNELILAKLRGIIGKQTIVVMHSTVDTGECIPEVKESDWEYPIILCGIFGVGKMPIYIHGKDADGKNILLRNNSSIMAEESTGIIYYRRENELTKLGDIDIKNWFGNSRLTLDEKSEFEKKLLRSRPDDKHLAIKLLNGQPTYYPSSSPRIDPSYSFFDNWDFIKNVLAHLEKIV